MTELEALLGGIVSEPLEETRWLVLADWLESNDDPRRGELIRLHRKLLATCCEPEAHPERKAWQARVVELIGVGVRLCLPQREVVLTDGGLITFSYIPPGTFLMGGNVTDDEKPVHKVTLTKGFYLGVHPVTQALWKAVMGKAPSHFKGEARPVEQVSWTDCQKFCKKLSKSLKGLGKVGLPTESEWEYACRAGATSDFHFGDVITTDFANYDGNHVWNDSPKGKYRETTTDVGSFPANPWGLYDMHGNVWEWCEDWYESYPPSDQADPKGSANGDYRMLRGGSWDYVPVNCRAACRDKFSPAYSYFNVGFRVCFRPD
ncbi:MAG: SUMF1/EgtB/PvdO family nonheme iron enzyme [Planctomycetes bacterium]|nr:SUMF1/EgtB/PvdO family nonheme iron enzyme [Planctomycetota bacterium]